MKTFKQNLKEEDISIDYFKTLIEDIDYSIEVINKYEELAKKSEQSESVIYDLKKIKDYIKEYNKEDPAQYDMTEDEMENVLDALDDMKRMYDEFSEAVNFLNEFYNFFKTEGGKTLVKMMKSKEVKKATKLKKYL